MVQFTCYIVYTHTHPLHHEAHSVERSKRKIANRHNGNESIARKIETLCQWLSSEKRTEKRCCVVLSSCGFILIDLYIQFRLSSSHINHRTIRSISKKYHVQTQSEADQGILLTAESEAFDSSLHAHMNCVCACVFVCMPFDVNR